MPSPLVKLQVQLDVALDDVGLTTRLVIGRSTSPDRDLRADLLLEDVDDRLGSLSRRISVELLVLTNGDNIQLAEDVRKSVLSDLPEVTDEQVDMAVACNDLPVQDELGVLVGSNGDQPRLELTSSVIPGTHIDQTNTVLPFGKTSTAAELRDH